MRDRIAEVLEIIAQAERASGRPSGSASLMAVTKNRSIREIHEAASCGITLFGENRVQELAGKSSDLPEGISMHMIGALQSNKAAKAVEMSDCIQSVDREKILVRIDRCAVQADKIMDIMVEVNTSGEPSKHGVETEDDLMRLIERSLSCQSVRLTGLMTLGPLSGDEAAIRGSFAKLRQLRERVEASFGELGGLMLSMGMSGDFAIAVEEGSDLVRVGTAIFGRAHG